MKSVLLIFTLMLNMNSLWAAACSYPVGDALNTQQKSCDSRAGKKWDCNLNRCLNTEDAVKTRTAYLACDKLTSSSEKKACYDKLAAESAAREGAQLGLGDTLPDGVMDRSIDGSIAANEALVLGALMLAFVGQGSTFSNCTSAKIFGGGAILALINEIKMYQDMKKTTGELQKKYEETASNSYNAQIKAFEYLREGQSLVKSLAEDKVKHHQMIAMTYGIASVWGFIEGSTSYGTKVCSGTTTLSNPNKLTELYTHFENSLSLIIAQAQAADQSASSAVGKMTKNQEQYLQLLGIGGVTGAVLGHYNIVPFLKTPYGVASIAATGAGLNLKLSKSYDQLIERTNSNIKKLDDIIAAFKNSMSQLCPNGRESLSDPRCYCTRADGTRNSDRSNSQTCQAYWAQLDRSFFVAADYYGRLKEGGKRGCVFINGQYDSSCQCKGMVDANTKQNACMKVALSGINFGSMGTAMGMQGAMDNLNSAFSGNLGLGGINLAALSGSNARGTKIADELRSKVNADLIKQGKTPLPSSEKLMDQLLNNAAIKELAKAGAASTLDPSSALLTYAPASDGAKEALKEALAKSSFIEEGGKGLKNAKSSKPNDPSFNFQGGAVAGTAANQLSFDDGVMNKNYDYKDNDINSNEDTPIWNIISARYLHSGLRRLFELEEKKE